MFCVPGDNVIIVIVSGGGGALTVRLAVYVSDAANAALTGTVKLLVPVPVGVPDITPVLVVKSSPAGSVPSLIDQE